jgi:dipeptidase
LKVNTRASPVAVYFPQIVTLTFLQAFLLRQATKLLLTDKSFVLLNKRINFITNLIYMKRFALLLPVLMLVYTSFACTIIVAGKKATTDGSVIVSHTDCGDDCRIRVVPGEKFKDGEMAPVYWGIQRIDLPLGDNGEIIGYIPQVKETYSYFHSAYSHMNEHQLAIGESTTSQRQEVKFKREDGKQIMTVEQAQIFALQRCKTAKEALKLITHLMETYGFLPSCVGESETLAIADTEEVWILEIYSVGGDWDPKSGKKGAIWTAKRVPDENALIVPNWSIIKSIDTTQNDCMASANYMSFAIEKGWYTLGNGKFNWQKTYSPIPREWATSRFWLFYSTVSPNLKEWPNRKLNSVYDTQNPYIQYVEDLDLYPFSAKVEKKLSVQDIMEFQRSTFTGTIYDMSEDPDWYTTGRDGKIQKSPLATPFPRRDMQHLLDITRRRNIAMGSYGMIAQLRGWMPDEIGGIYWVYQDNQVAAPYVPIYAGVQKIHESYNNYDPDKYNENSARWVYDFVDNLLYLKWQEAYFNDLKPMRDSLENAMLLDMQDLEKRMLTLYKSNPKKVNKELTEYTKMQMLNMMDAWRELRNTLLVKYTNNNQGINF